MSVIVNGSTGGGGVSDVGDLTTTGLTPTNYLRVATPDGLEERTPANVLSDIGAEASGAASIVQNNLTNHINDTTAAHDDSAIGAAASATNYTPTAANVEGHLSGIDTALGSVGGAVSSVFARTGAVVATSGDYTASQITNTPAGTIAAVTVQAAIDELGTEKAALSGATFTGNISLSNAGASITIGDASGFPTLKLRGSLTALLSTDTELQIGTGYSFVAARTTLNVNYETAGTNDTINGLILQRRTSGTAAAGIGIRQQFQVENSAGNTAHVAAEIAVTTPNATDATRTGKMVVGVYYGAYPGTLQPVINLLSASAGPQLSFFAATPQAQSTGWAVTNVTEDKVFDANSTSIDEIADVLGTLITYLIARGDLAA